MDPEPDSFRTFSETPDAGSRRDAERILEALAEMPERRRTIFLAARRDGLSHATIAERTGLGVRDVEREIAAALLDIDAALEPMERVPPWRRLLAPLHRLTGR